MEFLQLSEALRRDAVWVVFFNVLLQQAGLPVPAVPTLLLAGSLATTSGQLFAVLAAAIIASVIADGAWYRVGRTFGYQVLSGLCKLSINPGSCVSHAEDQFLRWGLASLIIAKFIPGFSTVAPPIAGSLRMALPSFLLSAAAGAALWAGVALGIGWTLRNEVQAVITTLDTNAGYTVTVIVLLIVAWLSWKLWQKYRFRKLSVLPHITAGELLAIKDAQQPLLVLDLRSSQTIAETGTIVGATVSKHDHLLEAVDQWPKSGLIVTLCACPEDAGAVQAAHRLLNEGYLSVRPLKGGYAAWSSAVNVKP